MRTALMIAMCIALAASPACEKKRSRSAGAGNTASAGENTGENAADVYRAAWQKIDTNLNMGAGSVALSSAGPATDGSFGNWQQVAGVLRDRQGVVADLMKAASLERCDFGLPRLTATPTEQEFKPVLDVTGRMRATARVLRGGIL